MSLMLYGALTPKSMALCLRIRAMWAYVSERLLSKALNPGSEASYHEEMQKAHGLSFTLGGIHLFH
jgi:hypothetical protein